MRCTWRRVNSTGSFTAPRLTRTSSEWISCRFGSRLLSSRDGNPVKSVLNGMTTYYVGNYYEWTGSNSVAGAHRRSEAGRAGKLAAASLRERRQW